MAVLQGKGQLDELMNFSLSRIIEAGIKNFQRGIVLTGLEHA